MGNRSTAKNPLLILKATVGTQYCLVKYFSAYVISLRFVMKSSTKMCQNPNLLSDKRDAI
jgi:hypothetical protein